MTNLSEAMIEAGFRELWGTELSQLGDDPANYKRAVERIYTAMQQAATPADPERFLTAYVSQDTRVIGIEHDTDASWEEVLAAHEALRDRLNLRIAEQRKCPFATPAAPVPQGCSCTSYPHTCELEARYYAAQATEAAPVQDALETARQRAIVLFQAYARGVAERHGRSEKQFIHDVKTFSNELADALKVPISTAPVRDDDAEWRAFDRVLCLLNSLDVPEGQTADEMRRRIYGLIHDLRPARLTPKAQDDDALRERVRDFIYDCTKDEFQTGWTLSKHQADDVIRMARLTADRTPLLQSLKTWVAGLPDDMESQPQVLADICRELAALREAPAADRTPLVEALRECQDKLWVIHFGLKDDAEREAAINAVNMASNALREVPHAE